MLTTTQAWPWALHSPWGLVLGGRLQVLLDALVVVHLRGHWDGNRCSAPATGEGAGPAVGADGQGGVTGIGRWDGWELTLPLCARGASGQGWPWDTLQKVGEDGRPCGHWGLMPTLPVSPGMLVALAPGGSYSRPPLGLCPFSSPFCWTTHEHWGTHSQSLSTHPEGLGELLQGGDGDGVRPWLSRPAEATNELLEGQSGWAVKSLHRPWPLPGPPCLGTAAWASPAA